jgi:hypothetical protein
MSDLGGRYGLKAYGQVLRMGYILNMPTHFFEVHVKGTCSDRMEAASSTTDGMLAVVAQSAMTGPFGVLFVTPTSEGRVSTPDDLNLHPSLATLAIPGRGNDSNGVA